MSPTTQQPAAPRGAGGKGGGGGGGTEGGASLRDGRSAANATVPTVRAASDAAARKRDFFIG